MPKRIEVAVGVVVNSSCQVLVGQRTVKDDYFEKWEFPGGKLEPDESAETALKRELKEETGLQVASSEEMLVLEHDYPDRHVKLHVYLVTEFSGEASGREGQQLRWVSADELNQLDFLAGNRTIIQQVQQFL